MTAASSTGDIARPLLDADFAQLLDPSVIGAKGGANDEPATSDPSAYILRKGEEFAARYGDSLTLAVFTRDAGVSRREIALWFNSWKNLRLQLGLPATHRTRRRGPTGEEIQTAYRQLIDRLGPSVTLMQLCKATGWSDATIRDRWQSFGNLRKSLGLSHKVSVRNTYSDEEIIADVHAAWVAEGRPGRFLTVTAYSRRGRHSRETLYRRFESWRDIEAKVRAMDE